MSEILTQKVGESEELKMNLNLKVAVDFLFKNKDFQKWLQNEYEKKRYGDPFFVLNLLGRKKEYTDNPEKFLEEIKKIKNPLEVLYNRYLEEVPINESVKNNKVNPATKVLHKMNEVFADSKQVLEKYYKLLKETEITYKDLKVLLSLSVSEVKAFLRQINEIDLTTIENIVPDKKKLKGLSRLFKKIDMQLFIRTIEVLAISYGILPVEGIAEEVNLADFYESMSVIENFELQHIPTASIVLGGGKGITMPEKLEPYKSDERERIVLGQGTNDAWLYEGSFFVLLKEYFRRSIIVNNKESREAKLSFIEEQVPLITEDQVIISLGGHGLSIDANSITNESGEPINDIQLKETIVFYKQPEVINEGEYQILDVQKIGEKGISARFIINHPKFEFNGEVLTLKMDIGVGRDSRNIASIVKEEVSKLFFIIDIKDEGIWANEVLSLVPQEKLKILVIDTCFSFFDYSEIPPNTLVFLPNTNGSEETANIVGEEYEAILRENILNHGQEPFGKYILDIMCSRSQHRSTYKGREIAVYRDKEGNYYKIEVYK